MNLYPSQPPSPPRTVLITGASGAIGRALCLRFAKSGWRVGVHWQTRLEEARATAQRLKDLGADASLHQADVRKADEVERMVRAFTETWGSIDTLVCTAGAASGQLAVKTTEQEWARMIDTNLSGAFFCMQAAAARMSPRRQGSILVIGSYAGFHGSVGQAAYAASKAGLIGLVRSAAQEWGQDGIRVNLLLPGWQASSLAGPAADAPARFDDHVLHRPPRLRTVAAAAYRLAGSRETSGQIWNVDSRIL